MADKLLGALCSFCCKGIFEAAAIFIGESLRNHGPRLPYYAEEDFRGAIPGAIVQSIFCTPIIGTCLACSTFSPGEAEGARVGAGIGFLVYGIVLVLIEISASSNFNSGLIIGILLVLIGVLYLLIAFTRRSSYQKETSSGSGVDHTAKYANSYGGAAAPGSSGHPAGYAGAQYAASGPSYTAAPPAAYYADPTSYQQFV